MYDAIILAGGENSEPLSEFAAEAYEAMIDIDGKPMVTFVAEALAATPQVGRIFVVGPLTALAKCTFPPGTSCVASGRSILETIQQGMAALGHQHKVLIVTADIPLLTPAAVEDFLAQCGAAEADLYYPIVSKEDNNRHYPGNQRTYVRFHDGVFTGGNIFLVNPQVVPQCMAVARRLIDNRKKPLQLCRLLGWGFVVQFFLGTLSVQKVKERVAELLGIRGAVIRSAYPELGIDVDKPSDLELVRAAFALRG